MLHAEEVPKIGYNDYRVGYNDNRVCQESNLFILLKTTVGILVTLMLEKLKPVKHKICQKWIHVSIVFTVSL